MRNSSGAQVTGVSKTLPAIRRLEEAVVFKFVPKPKSGGKIRLMIDDPNDLIGEVEVYRSHGEEVISV
ncbi:hypothetical protein SH668x_001244 [Planctomicrobium sp. SH668]|uniref:hypothetical protein n=1 Tax=Planctomicrobium sp. SH668 TaxID=3448126 RepID=UPI003F5BADA1